MESLQFVSIYYFFDIRNNFLIFLVLTAYFIVIVIFDVISWIIYLLLLVFLIRCRLKDDRVISKEFFTLCIFNGVLDIIFVVEEYVNFRIPQFGFFEDFYEDVLAYSTAAGVCYVYSLCQIIVISLSGITLTFNRFYAIKFPTKYKEFWSGWKLFLLTIWPITVVVPIFIVYCSTKVNFIVDPLSGRIFQNFFDEKVNRDIWSVVIGLHITALIINGVLNIFLIRIIRKEFGSRTNVNNQDSDNRIDLAMSKYAIIHFICFGMIAILETVIVFAFKGGLTYLAYDCLTIYVLAETMMVFFSPYALLILSKDIRKRFFLFLGLGKLNKIFNSSANGLTANNINATHQTRSQKTTNLPSQPQRQNLVENIII
uniref:Serpentine receptor class gamma n=1 Tax=Strongyloides papillosus TaxID=174720 RepID=A0A0N5C7B8_STREA